MEVESLTNGPPAKRLFVGLQIYGDQAIKLAPAGIVLRGAGSRHHPPLRILAPDRESTQGSHCPD